MAGTTRNYLFPYPSNGDVPNVAGDIANLANAVDGRIPDLSLGPIGAGVSAYGDCRVAQNGSGANMSVDVAAGIAHLRNGTRLDPVHVDVTTNLTIAAADATNPRIDIVVLEPDSTPPRVITGTPTVGATLDNRTGAAATPSPGLLLADVLVAAADTAISNSEIRDRRPVAAGTPTIKTAVDMVPLLPAPGVAVEPLGVILSPTGTQVAMLVQVPRKIVGATRIRWSYKQGATASVNTYVLGLYDASGRKIVDTGSLTFTGAANSVQRQAEVITATTFEAGWYYLMMGLGNVDANQPSFPRMVASLSAWAYPNVVLTIGAGAVTAPQTLLSYVDAGSSNPSATPILPVCALSVG
jgi:hypothetical protein